MATKLSFYNGRTYTLESEFFEDIIGNVSMKKSVNGSCYCELSILINPSNSSFLNSLKENSHFVTFSLDDQNNIFTGILDNAFCSDDVCSIKFIGFIEYLDKIRAISSFKATDLTNNVVVSKNDKSWEKNFLSDTSEGLIYEILLNLEEFMNANGFTRFWEWGNVFDHILQVGTNTWKKNYRLNSTELPTMKTIMEDILNDDSCARLRVDTTTTNGFKWLLNFNAAPAIKVLNSATSNIYDIQYEFSGAKSRTTSISKGQNVDNETILSKVQFDNTVAFSDFIPGETTNKSTSSNLSSLNANSIASLKKITGQVSFKTQDPSLCTISDNISITTDTRTTNFIVSEVSFDGVEFTITGNTVSTNENLSFIKVNKPENSLSSVIKNPLDSSFSNARKSVFEENRSTGWREL